MSKHKCNKDLYVKFLNVTSQRYSALSLSEVSPTEISHDGVSRWLSETKVTPKDIWEKAEKHIETKDNGVIIADETVVSKSRSKEIQIAHYQYSGNEHDVIKGIGVLNFIWQTEPGDYTPIDYRIWNPPEDGKTKNDHFREMLKLVRERGFKPECILADGWYSSLDNLKCIRDYGWNWIMPIKKNRKVNRNEELGELTIPDEGLRVHLRGYGWIHVFKIESKNGRIKYIGTNITDPRRDQIETYVMRRWDIEVYHRELKQACGIEECQARTSRSQRNHIGLSILCWIEQTEKRIVDGMSIYKHQWEIVKPAIRQRLKIELMKH